MRQILTVFRFTFINAAKKKAFWISTVVMILLLGILALMPNIISTLSEQSVGSDKEKQVRQSCYFVDENALFEDAITALTENFEDTDFTLGNAAQMDTYTEEVQSSENTSMIVVTLQEGKPFINVITKDFRSGISASRATDVLSLEYVTQTLSSQGLDTQTIDALVQSSLPFDSVILNSNGLVTEIVGELASILIFFAVYFYSYGVSMTVASDKTSRVMETLVVAAKPSRILIGKCLGMGVLGLTQFLLIVLSGTALFTVLIPGDFELFGTTVSLSIFTWQTVCLLLLYFILGYSLFALFHAVCGAMVSKVEDINSALMPVSIISIISFYLGFFGALSSSNGIIQQIALYLPFSSPFFVPARLLSGELSATQIFISVGILLMSIVVVTILAIRIYSAKVLSSGKGMKVKELARSSK